MAKEKGRLKVSNKLGGTIKIGKKIYSVPKIYDLSPRERFNNKDCEIEIENGSVVAVFVRGQELPKDTEAAEKKAERIKKRQEEETHRKKEQEEKKKNERLAREHGNDSFDITKAFCPVDTGNLNIQAYQVDNFLLKFKRFARFTENERDYSKSKFDFFKMEGRDVEFQIISKYGDTDFQAIALRAKKNAKALLGEKNCRIFETATAGRLIAGLGGASVYEIDITLHHIYGFPYISASSIKGVVRSWIIMNVFGADEKNPEEKSHPLINAEFRAFKDKHFCEIFGCPSNTSEVVFENGEPVFEKDKHGKETEKHKTYKPVDVALLNKEGKGQEHQGEVLFFDAYPMQAPKVMPDIMTPHYTQYYGDSDNKNNIAPTDTQMPVPIPFLTVDKKTPFQFIIGAKKGKLSDLKIDGRTVEYWLKHALQNHGIGAKTAVGYGYME